jgi:hypothetical protein
LLADLDTVSHRSKRAEAIALRIVVRGRDVETRMLKTRLLPPRLEEEENIVKERL